MLLHLSKPCPAKTAMAVSAAVYLDWTKLALLSLLLLVDLSG